MRKRQILEKVSVFLVGLFLFAICPPEGNGKTRDYFLTLGTGARALGMGSAFCGVADEANAVYWNPAGLALLYKPEITGLHIDLREETLYDSLNYAHPLGKLGTFGLGFIRLSVDEIEKREGPLDEVSKFSDTEMAFFTSYSRNIWREISGGISLKGIEHKIDTYQDTGFGMDVGFLWCLPANFSIGVNVQNAFSPTLKLKSKEDKYPLNTKIGIAYSVFNLLPRHKNKLTFAVDLDKSEGVEIEQHYGLEYWFKDMFAFRGGYDSINDFTGGLGIRYRNYQCDYAIASHELGETHRFSFTSRFGYTQEEKEKMLRQKERKEKIAQAEECYKEGQKKAKAGDYQGAIEIWNKEALPWVWVSGDEKLEKKIEDSIWKAEREVDKEKETRFFAEGIRLARQGEYLKAYKDFKQVLAINPLHKDAKLQADEMKKKMVGAVDINEEARFHFERGLDVYATGMYDVAIREWEAALKVEPTFERLEKYIKKVNKEKKGVVPLHVRLGNEHYQKKEYLQAIKEWKLVLASDPENEEVMEKIIQVRKEMENIIQRRFTEGKRELERNNLVKAMEKFISILKIDPNNREARKYITLVQKQLERLEEEKLTPKPKPRPRPRPESKVKIPKEEVSPEKIDNLLKKAEDYYFNHRYEKAIEVLNKVLELDPANKQAQKFLERVEKVKGK